MTNFKLPMEAGQSSTLWERDGERVRVKREGDGWVLLTEYNDCDEWADAGVSLEGLRDSWGDLVIAIGPHKTFAHQFMEVMVKPKKPKIDYKQKTTLARITGDGRWRVSWSVDGEDSYGRPFLRLEFSRPLNADEMVTMIGQMAKAFDAWDAEYGYV